MGTSYQFFKNPCSSSTSSSSSSLRSEKQRSCSTAQSCLFKILRTISTIPPENTAKVQPLLSSQLEEPQFGGKMESICGFSVDLNVGFCVSPEIGESGSTAAGSENSGGVFTVGVGKYELGEEEKSLDSECCSEVEVHINGELSGAGDEILQLESNGVSENTRKMGKLEEEQGFMGLLIEAARLIFGEFKDEGCEFEPEPDKRTIEPHNSGSRTKQLKRRNKCWGMESVDGKCSSPVVRSKRGRIQVLPYKYRDSVIEPLARFSRNRSSIIASKRQGSIQGDIR